MHQAANRFPAGDDSAEQDNADDEDAGEVLDTPEPVRESGAGLTPHEAERHPERHRRRSVPAIVDGVGAHPPAAPRAHPPAPSRPRTSATATGPPVPPRA